MKQHHKAKHGADVPEMDENFIFVLTVIRGTVLRKVGLNTSHIVWITLIIRVLFIAG